jgi:large conductance mechanosensitive channel
MLKEFRNFLSQGNILDLALAVIIGGAFGPVIQSMVNDILMPPIGFLLGKVNFSELSILLYDDTSEANKDVVIGYGKLIQAIINFLIIATVVFLLMKASASTKKQAAEAQAPAPPAPSNEEKLLTEIRDLLQKKG